MEDFYISYQLVPFNDVRIHDTIAGHNVIFAGPLHKVVDPRSSTMVKTDTWEVEAEGGLVLRGKPDSVVKVGRKIYRRASK
jgi:hypothetical protein